MYRMPAERVTHPKSAMSTIMRSILPPPPISLRIILRALHAENYLKYCLAAHMALLCGNNHRKSYVGVAVDATHSSPFSASRTAMTT